MKLTQPQQIALDKLRAETFPTYTAASGDVYLVTGINCTTLKGLKKKGAINYNWVRLGGLVEDLEIIEQ